MIVLEPVNLCKTEQTLCFSNQKKKLIEVWTSVSLPNEPTWAPRRRLHSSLHFHLNQQTAPTSNSLIKQCSTSRFHCSTAPPLDWKNSRWRKQSMYNSAVKEEKVNTEEMKLNNRREERGEARKTAATKGESSKTGKRKENIKTQKWRRSSKP